MEQLILPEVATASLFCQRWNRGVMSWQLAEPGERFDARRYEVHPIGDDTTARTYIIENHYAKSYVSAKYRFGLYRADRLVGVAVFSSPTNDLVLLNAFPESWGAWCSTMRSRATVKLRNVASGGTFVSVDRVATPLAEPATH